MLTLDDHNGRYFIPISFIVGIQTILWIINRPDQEKLFSTSCVIEALEITLDYNIATFNGQTFRQIKGAAMGPKNACEYADRSMDIGYDRPVSEQPWWTHQSL